MNNNFLLTRTLRYQIKKLNKIERWIFMAKAIKANVGVISICSGQVF